MKRSTLGKTAWMSAFAAFGMLVTTGSAQPARMGGLFGDWLVKADFNGRPMESILAFGRNAEGQTGQWISFFGVSDLKDITFENGDLSFTWTRPNRDGGTSSSKFTGKIEDGKLTGTLASDMGEMKFEGERAPRMPRAVGQWAMTTTMGDREFTSTLVITSDRERNLSGKWESQRGESAVTDLVVDRQDVSFKRTMKFQDREFTSSFKGTLEGDTLAGTMTSDRGEATVKGERIGAALIGTWNLEVSTQDFGTRPQRLRVNPDLSGYYGAMAVDKIGLNENQISFKKTLQFGDNEFEMNFAGTIDGDKLTGEMTTSRGTQKVTGTKVVRQFRMRGGNNQ
ncbi:MAG: hypothetical protein KDM81_00780 [Verrucomicrobiae bacterium]|nr:hypothetical protein [Verrucomicrobiae bacterium]